MPELSGILYFINVFTESDGVMADKSELHLAGDDSNHLARIIAEKAEKAKYLIIAATLAVIACIVLVSYQRSAQEKRSAEAKNKVFETLAKVQQANQQPGTEAAVAFGKAAQDFSGTPAGAQARLLQFAFTYNNDNDFAGAEQAAREFIKTYPNSPMIPRVKLALAQALMQQDKLGDAVNTLRALETTNDPYTIPEVKLALAQALEREAELFKDNPEEYRVKLETALAEYNDIVTRAQITTPAQRGFWPQTVVLPADYSMVLLKDRLNGHTFAAPTSAAISEATQAVMGGVENISLPVDEVPAASVAEIEQPAVEVAVPEVPAEEAPAEQSQE